MPAPAPLLWLPLLAALTGHPWGHQSGHIDNAPAAEWRCDFGWSPFRDDTDRKEQGLAVYRQNDFFAAAFEHKIAEHRYFGECGIPHVPVLGFGYFNPGDGEQFDGAILDRPFPYIARLSQTFQGRGTFKIGDEKDLAAFRSYLHGYRGKIAETGRAPQDRQPSHEGVILTALVRLRAEICSYTVFGKIGTVWVRGGYNMHGVSNETLTLCYVSNNVAQPHVHCSNRTSMRNKKFDDVQRNKEREIMVMGHLPALQRLAARVSRDWKAPLFRLDVFVTDDGSLLVNELTHPSSLPMGHRDIRRWNSRVSSTGAHGCKPTTELYTCRY